MVENKYRCKNCLVGYQNKPEDGQKCKHCGLTLVVELIPGYVEVSDLSGRTDVVKRTSLKPSVWAQGNEVSTHI